MERKPRPWKISTIGSEQCIEEDRNGRMLLHVLTGRNRSGPFIGPLNLENSLSSFLVLFFFFFLPRKTKNNFF